MRYSIDSSSLIRGWREVYPFEHFSSLWTRDLPGLIEKGVLRASEEIRIELSRQDDELLAWAEEYPDLFVPIDEATQFEVKDILAAHSSLVERAGARRSGGDAFVIALARLNGCAVVTEEASKPTQPRIPDVCEALGVPCVRFVTLIREENFQY
ncbi:MAG: DUF4411 family protein [Gaiellaceae bacterium]|jgi:hypothetical protein